jgi:hypothetical protein
MSTGLRKITDKWFKGWLAIWVESLRLWTPDFSKKMALIIVKRLRDTALLPWIFPGFLFVLWVLLVGSPLAVCVVETLWGALLVWTMRPSLWDKDWAYLGHGWRVAFAALVILLPLNFWHPSIMIFMLPYALLWLLCIADARPTARDYLLSFLVCDRLWWRNLPVILTISIFWYLLFEMCLFLNLGALWLAIGVSSLVALLVALYSVWVNRDYERYYR